LDDRRARPYFPPFVYCDGNFFDNMGNGKVQVDIIAIGRNTIGMETSIGNFWLNIRDFTIAKKSDTLRVLTWNVSSWGETSKPGWIPNSDEHMINLINDQQPDVLCLQEFYDRRAITQGYSIVRIFKSMGYEYSYFVRSLYGDVKYKTGVAILSKYPILDTAKFKYGEKVFAEPPYICRHPL
jgi:hypothetical protein